MPPLAGGAMSLFGAPGLPITLGLICLGLVVASALALRGGLNSRRAVG